MSNGLGQCIYHLSVLNERSRTFLAMQYELVMECTILQNSLFRRWAKNFRKMADCSIYLYPFTRHHIECRTLGRFHLACFIDPQNALVCQLLQMLISRNESLRFQFKTFSSARRAYSRTMRRWLQLAIRSTDSINKKVKIETH